MEATSRPSVCRAATLIAAVLLTVGCAGTPATPDAAPASQPGASAAPSPVTSRPAAPTDRPTPSASISISDWMRLPATGVFRAAMMTRIVAGPAGLLALGGTDGPGFITWWSRDGLEWTRSGYAGIAVAGDAVAVADGFLVLGKVGDGPDAERAMAWRSADGAQWTGSPIGELRTGPFAADRIGDRISAFAIRAPAGGEPTFAWSSKDLVAWASGMLGGGGFSTVIGMTALADGSGLAFGRWSNEPQDIAPFPVGQAAFWQSTDGAAWQKMPDDPDLRDAQVIDAAQVPGAVIVAVGQRWNPALSPDQPFTIAAWSSSDGRSWEPATWPSSLERTWVPLKVAPTGSGVVLLAAPRAGGANALIARTTDGRTWTALDPPITFEGGQANDLVAVDSHLVVVGQTLPPGGTPADAVVWIGPAASD